MAAFSNWPMVVQAGAVGVSIVLSWVILKLWATIVEERRQKDEAQREKEKILVKWLERNQEDAGEEREFTKTFVEVLTKVNQALEAVLKLQQEIASRLNDNHKRLELMERNCAKQ